MGTCTPNIRTLNSLHWKERVTCLEEKAGCRGCDGQDASMSWAGLDRTNIGSDVMLGGLGRITTFLGHLLQWLGLGHAC